MQRRNFSKIWSKMFENIFVENIASLSCRECHPLASDMRIIIPLPIMNKGRHFLLALQTDRQTDEPILF